MRESPEMIFVCSGKRCAVHQVLFWRDRHDTGYQGVDMSVMAITFQDPILQSKHLRVFIKGLKGSSKGYDKGEEIEGIGRWISVQTVKELSPASHQKDVMGYPERELLPQW